MTATIISLVLKGLAALPGILSAFNTIFKTSNASSRQKADAITSVAGTVIDMIGDVSTGGTNEAMDKATQVLPMFNDLTANLMSLAEASGKPGIEKQGYVTGIVTAAMQGWEQLSTGGQAATVAEIKPIVNAAVDVLVPIMFPNDATAVENLQPSG